MLILREEKYETIAKDMAPLLYAHWEEIATDKDKVFLDPNLEAYKQLEKIDKLLTIAVRDEEKLVGYSVFFVSFHFHYQQTKMAINDILYLAPEYRKGFTGIKLIKYAEKLCKERGVHKIIYHIKTEHNFGLILKRMGYIDFEINYGKYIGE